MNDNMTQELNMTPLSALDQRLGPGGIGVWKPGLLPGRIVTPEDIVDVSSLPSKPVDDIPEGYFPVPVETREHGLHDGSPYPYYDSIYPSGLISRTAGHVNDIESMGNGLLVAGRHAREVGSNGVLTPSEVIHSQDGLLLPGPQVKGKLVTPESPYRLTNIIGTVSRFALCLLACIPLVYELAKPHSVHAQGPNTAIQSQNINIFQLVSVLNGLSRIQYLDRAQIYGTPQSRITQLIAASSALNSLGLDGFPTQVLILDPTSPELSEGVDHNVYGNLSKNLGSPNGTMVIGSDDKAKIYLSSKLGVDETTKTTRHEVGHSTDPWFNLSLRESNLWAGRQQIVVRDIYPVLAEYKFNPQIPGEIGIFYNSALKLGEELWSDFTGTIGANPEIYVIDESYLRSSLERLPPNHVFSAAIQRHLRGPYDVISGFSAVDLGAALMSLQYSQNWNVNWGSYGSVAFNAANNVAWGISAERWAENFARGGTMYPSWWELQTQCLNLARNCCR